VSKRILEPVTGFAPQECQTGETGLESDWMLPGLARVCQSPPGGNRVLILDRTPKQSMLSVGGERKSLGIGVGKRERACVACVSRRQGSRIADPTSPPTSSPAWSLLVRPPLAAVAPHSHARSSRFLCIDGIGIHAGPSERLQPPAKRAEFENGHLHRSALQGFCDL